MKLGRNSDKVCVWISSDLHPSDVEAWAFAEDCQGLLWVKLRNGARIGPRQTLSTSAFDFEDALDLRISAKEWRRRYDPCWVKHEIEVLSTLRF